MPNNGANTVRTNIFGDASISYSSGRPSFSTSETTAAGKLIDRLRYIAEGAIQDANGATSWLGIAANAGQNQGSESLVAAPLTRPDRIDGKNVLDGWSLPLLPDMPAFPALPDDFKIDFARVKQDVDADLLRLQTSWMARYLPSVADVSALDQLITNVLNGTQSAAATVKLDQLEISTKAALTAIVASTQSALNAAIANSKGNLAGNINSARTEIAGLHEVVRDDTQNVAFARARDQVAREGARLESEAISSWASRGFTLPGGVLNTQLQRQRQATMTAAADIAGRQAEKTQEMMISVGSTAVQAWLGIMQTQSSAELSQIGAILDANIRSADQQLNANQFAAKQAFDHLGLTLDFTKFSADLAQKYRLGVIEAMNNLVRSYAAVLQNDQQIIDAISRSRRDAYSAINDYYRAAIGAAEIGLRAELTNNENDIRYMQTAAGFIGTAVGHHVQAAGAAADVYARTAAMALSGLNGIASVASQT